MDSLGVSLARVKHKNTGNHSYVAVVANVTINSVFCRCKNLGTCGIRDSDLSVLGTVHPVHSGSYPSWGHEGDHILLGATMASAQGNQGVVYSVMLYCVRWGRA